jgi:serine/threonine protein kinase
MAQPATVTLTVVTGEGDQRRYVFDERMTCVPGRARDCDPRLPDDERHTTVSRHHCLIDINPPAARIRDFGSLNGTYVNGKKIGQRQPGQTPEEAAALTYPEHDLADGDELRLGGTVLRVTIAGDRTLTLTADAEPAALAGRIAGYALVRELGRGGMGAVYLARGAGTDEQVALKLMLPKVAASETARARFLREIRITRTLRHPNIVSLYEAGSTEGAFYFTSEYCAGGSLDRLLRREMLPRREAVRFVVEALAGLAHAHGQGVVHRDLSPHNILLTAGDEGAADGIRGLAAKVSDFGLAKAFDQAGLSGLTRTGATAGKPWYMPRQQVINFKDATPAADVWAMAACLYQALTGTCPRSFPPGKDPWHVVLQQPAVPVRDRDPSVPPELADVIDTALRERPAIGFQSAADFRDALLGTGIMDP